MLTPEQIDELNTVGGQLMTPITDWLLDDIVRRIKEASMFTSTAEYQVWRLKELGMKKGQINKELRRRLKMTQKQIDELITESAKAGYLQDVSRLKAQALPFEKNEYLQRLIAVTKALADKNLRNATQTMGWITPFGTEVGLTEAYQNCCDFAFKLVSSGAADYNTAVKLAIKNLVDKGIQIVDYDSGRRVSVEAAVRRSVIGGIGLMQEKISDENYKKLGATGWEISAHMASAPDHEPIQGRQYTNEEYRELNSNLARRIGTLNCKHIAFPIIYGETRPIYSAEQLEEMKRKNKEGITYGGKHYTMYEATQHQRALERSIRRQKRAVIASEASGDKDALLADKIRLTRLKQEYNEFSRTAGLPPQYARFEMGTTVSGRFTDEERQMLDNGKERGIIEPRGMANGGRRPPRMILNAEQIEVIKAEAQSLNIPLDIIKFNYGFQTGFSDTDKHIHIRGDVLPDLFSTQNRDTMSSKAVLAHEYYGHYLHYPTTLKRGEWRDEFRASYCAAINAPNLSDEERRSLMLDAYERAREARIIVKYNKIARRIIYGYE